MTMHGHRTVTDSVTDIVTLTGDRIVLVPSVVGMPRGHDRNSPMSVAASELR